jgi:pilus assembly protein CpaE
MQSRKAIIVADAAGVPEAASVALASAGVPMIVAATRLDQALARVRAEPFDILILSLQDLGQTQLELLAHEIRINPKLAVIGTAPAADPELILRAMRAGVHEFLVYPPSANDLASAARRLERRGGALPTGRVIAVYSGKGGLGTTSIAVNLADALARSAPVGSVALADCVFAAGDIRVVLNLRPAYDLSDLVAKLDEVDSSMLRSLMTTGPHGIAILPAADDPAYDDAFDGATVSTIVGQLKAAFDTIVIDCEHHLSERTLAVLDAADTIVLVTQPNVPALRSTKRTLELFGRLGYAKEKIAVILNRFQFGDVFTFRTIADSLGREVYWGLPNDYRTVSAALNRGITVATEDAGSKLARSFVQLADKLKGIGKPSDDETSSQNGALPSWSRFRTLFGKQREPSQVEASDHVA